MMTRTMKIMLVAAALMSTNASAFAEDDKKSKEEECPVEIGNDPTIKVCSDGLKINVSDKNFEKPLDPGVNSVPQQIDRNLLQPAGRALDNLGTHTDQRIIQPIRRFFGG